MRPPGEKEGRERRWGGEGGKAWQLLALGPCSGRARAERAEEDLAVRRAGALARLGEGEVEGEGEVGAWLRAQGSGAVGGRRASAAAG